MPEKAEIECAECGEVRWLVNPWAYFAHGEYYCPTCYRKLFGVQGHVYPCNHPIPELRCK